MIWLVPILLFLTGVFFSAFFSGSETGFYRVARVRLALDARGGDRVARLLLWVTNNPTLYVATSLIGNNLANYMTSLAIVLGTRWMWGGDSYGSELLVTIAFAPVVFVYGELLPKHLFYLAPNRLLRRGGALFLLCGALFAPVSAVLWSLGRCLQWLVGEAPEYVRSRLARKELKRVLEEGHQAGVLQSAQRQLAQGLFSVANEPVARFCSPIGRETTVRRGANRADLLRIVGRQHSPVVLVQDENGRQPVGYVRAIDLYLNPGDWHKLVLPLPRVRATDSHLATLIRMQTDKQPVAVVVDHRGEMVGTVSVARLTEPLMGEMP